MQLHGGIVGEALYRLADPLVQDLGVGILVVFLLVVGTILLTGASLATALRATGNGLLRHDTDGAPDRHAAAASGPIRGGSCCATSPTEPIVPPEPDPRELVVRATHVEAPSRDWMDEPPDQQELDRAQELLGMLPEHPAERAARLRRPAPEPRAPDPMPSRRMSRMRRSRSPGSRMPILRI